MPPKMEPLGTQNLKKSRKQIIQNNIEKTIRKKSDSDATWLHFGSPFSYPEATFSAPEAQKSTKSSKSVPGPPKLTNNLNSDLRKLSKNHDFGSPKSRQFACKLFAFCIALFTISCQRVFKNARSATHSGLLRRSWRSQLDMSTQSNQQHPHAPRTSSLLFRHLAEE